MTGSSSAPVGRPPPALVPSRRQQPMATMRSLPCQLRLFSTNAGEGVLSVNSLNFAPQQWNVPQTVTVTGVDDGLADGETSYAIVTGWAVSEDRDYHGINPDDVLLLNLDQSAPASPSASTVAPLARSAASSAQPASKPLPAQHRSLTTPEAAIRDTFFSDADLTSATVSETDLDDLGWLAECYHGKPQQRDSKDARSELLAIDALLARP